MTNNFKTNFKQNSHTSFIYTSLCTICSINNNL